MRSPQVSSQVDAYLERIAAQLAAMSSARREEQMDELRQHLAALIGQYEEIGVLPREAVEEALRQFGDPMQIGRRLLREWRLTERRAAKLRRAPVRYALHLLVWTSLFCFWVFDPLLARFHSSWFPNDFSLICFVPVFAGALTGFRWPERSVSAFLQAMLTLVASFVGGISLILLAGFVLSAVFYGLATGSVVFDIRGSFGLVGFFLVCCLRWLGLWLPLGLLAAYLSSAAKRRAFYRPELRRL